MGFFSNLFGNKKPVQEWQDHKLLDLYLNLSQAASQQSNLSKRSQLYDQANEVSDEIIRRQKVSNSFVENITKVDPHALNKLEQLGLKVKKETSSDIEKLKEKDPEALKVLDSLGMTDDIENSGGINSFLEEQAIIQSTIVEKLPALFNDLLNTNIANGMEENKAKENAKNRVLGKVLPYFERAKMDGMNVDEAVEFVVKKFS